MIDQIKQKAREAKEFAQKHPTLVSCTATALVVAKFTHDRNVKAFAEILYAKGYAYGELEAFTEALQLQNTVLIEFVTENALEDDVREFIKTISS
jgi:ribonuclease HII